MGKFQIMTPGGYEVEVSAANKDDALTTARANWQTMPRIIGRNGDTRVFETSSGQKYLVSPGFSTSDSAQIKDALAGMTAGDISKRSIDQGVLAQRPYLARAGEVLRGSIAGSYLDEGLGAVLGEGAKLDARALSGAMQRQHPGQTLGLNLAGGLTEAVGVAAAAPFKTAGLLANVAGSGRRASQVARAAGAGAAAGAGTGAIYGYGEGTTPETRAQSAGQGAAVGAAFGTAIGGATPIVAEAASN